MRGCGPYWIVYMPQRSLYTTTDARDTPMEFATKAKAVAFLRAEGAAHPGAGYEIRPKVQLLVEWGPPKSDYSWSLVL